MKISFIGAGNMASAIAKGALKKQFIAAENLYFYDIQVEKTAAFAQEIGAHAVASPQEAITVADLVILAVKPQFVQAALLEAKEAIFDKQPLIVSIAAGTTIAELHQLFETTQPLRLVRVMPNMNALIGAGVLPAIAVKIEKYCSSNSQAWPTARNNDNTENPWTLIDQVSSPGGTTVAGIVELENNAFISTVIKGIEATILRDQELAKQD